IATPQGCSGYSASAGGPLVHPDIHAFSLVPICPFFCNFPPLVLPYPQEVRIILPNNTTEVYLTVDGQEGYGLQTDDNILVRGLPGGVHFFRRDATGYLHRLKARGFLTERLESA
ncbi:MAG: NAD(+) kinase, partial [Desulfovibrionaceae bacterium]|nr:NAD(+) kinase [Desulfovibrionaceae bacterium]